MNQEEHSAARKEIIEAAYNFRATVRLTVRSARERQFAVERIDEGLLWALYGLDRDLEIDPESPDALDGPGSSRQT